MMTFSSYRFWLPPVPLLAVALLGCGLADRGIDEQGDLMVPAASAKPIIARTRTSAPASNAPAPDGSHTGDHVDVVAQAINSGHGIEYHGGHVMTGVPKMYYIWYGNWSGSSAPTIITDFGNNISGSPYYYINTLYDDNFGGAVSGTVALAGQTSDSYSQGTVLDLGRVYDVVTSAISQGRLPNDPNGVYFVLSSADVREVYLGKPGGKEFCTDYCGWHWFGNNIKFAFVGDGARCPSTCLANSGPGPNSNASADGMVNVIAHELEETVTDPNADAWTNVSTGEENADKCAWTFGNTFTAPNGAAANVKLGNRNYLIQQNWVNAGAGSCAMSRGSCGTLAPNESLARNQNLTSCDRRFSLAMQGDGNLVLYAAAGVALWNSGTAGTTGDFAVMQGDGNFVLYSTAGVALWNSGTGGHPGSTLAVQTDGNLVVRSPTGAVLWNAGTGGH